MISALWEWVKAFLVAVVIIAIVGVFFGTTSVVHTSMYPTLDDGDILLIYKKGQIERGDIITFRSSLTVSKEDMKELGFFRKLFVSEGDAKVLVKRVIGMPGDKLVIQEGKVFINDQLYNESFYLKEGTPGEVTIEKIPEGNYFVMGDNRSNSVDSRSEVIGLVQKKDIKGRAVLRVFPFTSIELFRGF